MSFQKKTPTLFKKGKKKTNARRSKKVRVEKNVCKMGELLPDGTIRWSVDEHGRLSEIPDDVVPRISELFASNCSLSDDQLDRFCIRLHRGGNTVFRKLNCIFNDLTGLPKSIADLTSLKEVLCSRNKMTAEPAFVKDLPNFEWLSWK